MSKIIVHLPTIGNPYVVIDKTENCKDLQQLVGGYFEDLNNKMWRIHPLFDNRGWNLARAIMLYGRSKTYVNDNGIGLDLGLNMACIWNTETIPLSGEVYLILTEKAYKKICDKQEYKLKEANWNEDQEEYEDEDEDEDEEEELVEAMNNVIV